jgi:hypothetical protein
MKGFAMRQRMYAMGAIREPDDSVSCLG